MTKEIKSLLGANLGKPFMNTMFKLNKKKIVSENVIGETIKKRKSIVLCFWHGRMLFPLDYFQKTGCYVLAGLHKDAETISKMLEKMGYIMIRGSSTIGGAKAYREIVKVLSKPGRRICITPDGPRGPKQKVKWGAVKAALHTGAVIIPVSGQASKRWEIQNWDTYVVPKPFGRVSIVFGEPMEINDLSEIEQKTLELEIELNRVQDLADAAVIDKI